ncbi:membrane primary amine oxidase-like [Mya arenaria]|uniref:membrane primary amine oxidase-like n=1 Tax=Mya arenaria TaxID=6604 RepID=UPI0022DF63E7|nr:membrane primary amine oxidase-like [Mya arenaria]
MAATPTPESEFSDIALTEADQQNGTSRISTAGTSGPWTQSGSYSKKVKVANALPGVTFTKVTPNRTVFVYSSAGAILFILGVGLGIVIGHFGIKMEVSTENLDGESSIAERVASSSSPEPFMTTEAPCACPRDSTTSALHTTTPPQCRQCPEINPDQSVGNEAASSPFSVLTEYELNLAIRILKVRNYISPTGNGLELNRAASVEMFPVDKTLVLDYLDNNGAFPGRFAKVMVVRGSLGDIMEYKVGPLHVPEDQINVNALTNEGEISFNARPFDPAEHYKLLQVMNPHTRAMDKVLSESFDGASFENKNINPNFYSRPSVDQNDRTSGVYLYLPGMGYPTLTMVPVSCVLHHPGADSSTWFASDFYYLGQGPFASGIELQAAYDRGELRKIRFPEGYRAATGNKFTLKLNDSLPPRPLADIPPPRSYETEGPRFVIKGHRISWLGWEFEYSSSRLMGPRIFDVKFQGTRIAYEISLQDITLIYSSQNNGAGPPALSDTVFSLGSYSSPRYGIDCPDRGKTISVARYSFANIKTSQSACVFEADGQEPLWRHSRSGLADHYLVVRAAMDLGNYDYTLEWRFHLDGSLETLLTASGYLYGAFWDVGDPSVSLHPDEPSVTPFGYRISDYLIGPIHDHTFAFKVDLDILGTNNSFEMIHWKSGTTLDAFQSRYNISEKPGFFFFNHTRFISPEFLENEQGFVSDPLKPKYFTVVNENERNVWGNRRGYRVIPYSNMAENLSPDHVMMDAWGHMRHQLAVTRRKESEQHATASWYDLQFPVRPVGGFGNLLDNETIRNTDLVLWVNEKFLHAPTAEDLPMTINVRSGFKLKPHNYFDRTPVFDVPSHYSRYKDAYVFEEPCFEPVP